MQQTKTEKKLLYAGMFRRKKKSWKDVPSKLPDINLPYQM